MREIKFRAWDVVNKEFIYLDIMNYNDMDYWSKFGRNFKEVQQFTGLKDKNGKEIYEGDIVINTHIGLEETKKIQKGLKDNVIKDIRNISNLIPESHKWEVIGNIYENPELLEPKTEVED